MNIPLKKSVNGSVNLQLVKDNIQHVLLHFLNFVCSPYYTVLA